MQYNFANYTNRKNKKYKTKYDGSNQLQKIIDAEQLSLKDERGGICYCDYSSTFRGNFTDNECKEQRSLAVFNGTTGAIRLNKYSVLR